MDDLHELWVSLNRPSPEKFRLALQRKGIAAPPVKYLREHFYKYQTSKQIFARPPRYTGKIYSPDMDRRWAADIIVNTQYPSVYKGKTYSYALVVQDIFSRYAWAELIDSPMDAYRGFEEILQKAGKVPEDITTDADSGFQAKVFQDLLANRHIHHTLRAGRNDLATVDRLISTIKRALAVHSAESGNSDWAERLQSAVKGYNDTSHPRLMQGAPDDLRGPGGAIKNKFIYFNREYEEAENMEHNDEQIRKRAAKLQGPDTGFRVFKHKESLGRRVFDPHWSREIHSVAQVEGGNVKDEEGEWYPSKEVFPVPKESTALPEPPSKLNAKAQGLLQRYADKAEDYLAAKEDRRDYASNLHKILSHDGYNVKEAIQLAGLSTKSVIASFVKVFPDKFKLVTAKKGGTSFVELR